MTEQPSDPTVPDEGRERQSRPDVDDLNDPDTTTGQERDGEAG